MIKKEYKSLNFYKNARFLYKDKLEEIARKIDKSKIYA